MSTPVNPVGHATVNAFEQMVHSWFHEERVTRKPTVSYEILIFVMDIPVILG